MSINKSDSFYINNIIKGMLCSELKIEDILSLSNNFQIRKEECDDLIEFIFRKMIYHGNISNMGSPYRDAGYRDCVMDIITFKQSKSRDITIAAKLIFKMSTQYKVKKEFIEWQLEKLFCGIEIDIQKEYEQFMNDDTITFPRTLDEDSIQYRKINNRYIQDLCEMSY